MFCFPQNCKLHVVGFVTSPDFQRCRYLAEKLHQYHPEWFQQPIVRPMLNVDWEVYLERSRRQYGGITWTLHTELVFVDEHLLGGVKQLQDLVQRSYFIQMQEDFEQMGCQQLVQYLSDIVHSFERKFVYLTITINSLVVGSLLFMLYNDVLPMTCNKFLRCCRRRPRTNSPRIHRIVRGGWIQLRGMGFHCPCIAAENYAVTHNGRGILSLIIDDDKRTGQFAISLAAQQWMDGHFVAFGQLLQGAEVLRTIEAVPEYYQTPLQLIEVSQCGEFALQTDQKAAMETLMKKWAAGGGDISIGKDVPVPSDNSDLASQLSCGAYIRGKYCLLTDLQSYTKRIEQYVQMAGEEAEDLHLNDRY